MHMHIQERDARPAFGGDLCIHICIRIRIHMHIQEREARPAFGGDDGVAAQLDALCHRMLRAGDEEAHMHIHMQMHIYIPYTYACCARATRSRPRLRVRGRVTMFRVTRVKP